MSSRRTLGGFVEVTDHGPTSPTGRPPVGTDRTTAPYLAQAAKRSGGQPASEGSSFFSLSCFARREPSRAPGSELSRSASNAARSSETGRNEFNRSASKTLPPGTKPGHPAAKLMAVSHRPMPGTVGPLSPAPFLGRRFPDRDLPTLCREHEGAPEPLFGPQAAKAAQTHLDDGWTEEVLAKFRQNEALCQYVFGMSWDARYGRSRVRRADTGELLCWGDGDSYTDVKAEGASVIDGAELTALLRDPQAKIKMKITTSVSSGALPGVPAAPEGSRVHLLGHPAGNKMIAAGSGYYRWIEKDPHGIDVDRLGK